MKHSQIVPHSVRVGLVTTLLLFGLAWVPTASWAGQDKGDRDSARGNQESSARDRQAGKDSKQTARQAQDQKGGRDQAQPPARVSRDQAPGAAQNSPRVMRDSPRPARQQPTTDAHSPYQPYTRWQQPSAPQGSTDQRSSPGRANGWGRRSQGSQDDTYQPYQPRRKPAAPDTGDNTGGVSRQPRMNRDTGSQPNPYQLYRQPQKAAAPEAPATGGITRGKRASTLDRGSATWQQGDNNPGQQPGVVKRGAQQTPKLDRSGTLKRAPQTQRGAGSASGSSGAIARPNIPRAERTFRVPEASFRGPKSDEQVRTVPKDSPVRLQSRMRDRIRQDNRQLGNWDSKVRLTHDVVGNRIPKDAVILNRTNVVNNNITINYTRIVHDFGSPRFGFLVAPRFFGGGVSFGGRRHHPIIVLNFFYPYYFSDPYFAGFWYGGYYPSVYSFWGWCPAWVYPTRVYYVPAEYYYTPPPTPYRYYGGGYGIDYRGADRAIDDTRRAWLDSDIGPLSAHLTDQLDIRVYFDGEYSYTTTTDDFYQMTLDTLSTTQTTEMDFDDPIWISSHEIFVTGQQVFYDPDGEQHVVYVSFRLRQLGTGWYLVAVGSSLQPIQHQYSDFRNQY